MYIQQVTFTNFINQQDYAQINKEYALGQYSFTDTVSSTLLLNTSLEEIDTLVRLYSIINLNSSVDSNLHITSVNNALMLLNSSLYNLKEEFINNSIKYSADVQGTLNKINYIASSFKLNAVAIPSGEFLNIVASALVLVDAISAGISLTLLSSMALSGELNSKLEAYNKLISNIAFAANIGSLSFTVLLDSSIAFKAEVSSYAILKSIIEAKLNFLGALAIDGEQFITYVLNTQSGGISEYTNYNFNSFSYPYAIASDGLYLLDEGDTDNGGKITASIKTGLLDFGSALHKQVPYAYLGVTSTGELMLNTITTNHGIKKEIWYKVKATNGAVDTARVKLAKGTKAKYWQFELSNEIDGEKFDIESMEVLPLLLKRRIQ